MTAPTLSVDGRMASKIRLVQPWTGAWFVEADLDGTGPAALPTGKVEIVALGQALRGTVDPSGSGRFGERVVVRVVAGGHGWSKDVVARHFHNDAQVRLSSVAAATAAEVGESASVTADELLGVDYVRTAGPASRVLEGRAWHVDHAGQTVVGPRLVETAPAAAKVRALDWAPDADRCELTSDAIVVPGWTLSDTRFATRTVRHVETTFDASGSKITAWCSAAAPEGSALGAALGGLVREIAGTTYCRAYRYRVFGMSGQRVELQIVKRASGAPDVLPVSLFPGIPGAHADLAPGTEVIVEFLEGNPSLPVVVAFVGKDGEAWKPKTLELDATERILLSPSGPGVTVGDGLTATAVALAQDIQTWAAAVKIACAANVPPITIPVLPPIAAGRLKSS